ncbi:hypothetical protein I7I53_07925 [Histoplasma capsulatum var. duboisii H88]|uniref:Uncharacterized protein n=1 Tax=Ajellomyces capsulatus (strain H88) TaxID=544711 RepID=A0A8A1LI42_AJEC8|nr:hypothetical protein I7I53_07925 [Histoplasma capsulatum var. duboisii H88]
MALCSCSSLIACDDRKPKDCQQTPTTYSHVSYCIFLCIFFELISLSPESGRSTGIRKWIPLLTGGSHMLCIHYLFSQTLAFHISSSLNRALVT